MIDFSKHISEYHSRGFSLVKNVFNNTEIESMIALIDDHFRKGASKEYSIRTLFDEIPGLKNLVINDPIKSILSRVFKSDMFISKALYFNKSNTENWYVPFHQDISIHVKEKHETEGYTMWTRKDNMVGVVPPVYILENTLTLRIHLDNTDIENGALRVIEGSHKMGIQNSSDVKEQISIATLCELPRGGVMVMSPLLFHASSKNNSTRPRRVIHLEFNSIALGGELEWAEKNQLTLDNGN